MTAWEVSIKRNDRIVVLVAADSLSKCLRYLRRHLLQIARLP